MRVFSMTCKVADIDPLPPRHQKSWTLQPVARPGRYALSMRKESCCPYDVQFTQKILVGNTCTIGTLAGQK